MKINKYTNKQIDKYIDNKLNTYILDSNIKNLQHQKKAVLGND